MNTEIDILNTVVGGMKIREMSAMTFLQYVAKKLNGVDAYSATSTELMMLVANPPMTRVMSDDAKLVIIEKLKKLNIDLP